MKYLVIHVVFGILCLPLALLKNKLIHPDADWLDSEILEDFSKNLAAILFLGSMMFIVGIGYFIGSIPEFQTKSNFILRKFES